MVDPQTFIAIGRGEGFTGSGDLPPAMSYLSIEDMRVTIRLFASHREAAGKDAVVAELPAGSTAADAFDRVCAEVPALRVAANSVAFAVNREHASPDSRLAEGDEVTLLPPVAGG